MRSVFDRVFRNIWTGIVYIVIALITVICSLMSVSDSESYSLHYSYPDENADYSTISWAEVPIDEEGHNFAFQYQAWDIGQIGIRLFFENEDVDNNGVITLNLLDSSGEDQCCEYNIGNLITDPDGITWFNVDKHVAAGNLILTIKNTGSNGLKVIGYSQEGILDNDGNTAFCPSMKISAASFPKSKVCLYAIAWTAVFLMLFLILKNRNISYERLFILLYLSLGVMAFSVYPAFAEPDSGNHYRRAFSVSEGVLFPELDEGNTIGGNFAWPSTWKRGDNAGISWYETRNRIGFDVTDPDNTMYLTYTNIALYSPVSHMIPAAGMLITRFFTNSIILIEMAARLFNFIAIGILLYLAIRITPFGKKYILWIITNPFMMKLYMSISPDIMTAALVYLLTAVVLRLRYDPEAYARKGYLAALYLVPFFLGQFKIVYIAFCLLLFMIPMVKFSSRRNYFIHATGVAAVTIVPALVWLKMSTHILSLGYAEIHSVNSEIVMDFGRYIPILINTIIKKGVDYIQQFFGSTLIFKDVANGTLVILFMLYVAAIVGINMQRKKNNSADIAEKVRSDTFQKLIISSGILVTMILIFTAEYIQWTEAGVSTIEGVNGRYFFPFVFPALILLTGMSDEEQIDRRTVTFSEYRELYILISITLCFAVQLFVVYQL